jgi:hypothetical protein
MEQKPIAQRARAAFAAAAFAAAACAKEPLPARVVAPEGLQRLTVFVEPQAKVVVTTEAVPKKKADELAGRVRAAVTQELSRAGFLVVSTPNEKSDFTVQLRVQVQAEQEAVVTAAAEREGIEVAKVGYASSHLGFGELAQHAGIHLVGAMVQQRQLAELARSPEAYVAARKPGAAPATPVVGATVAPSNAATAPASPASAGFVTAAPQPTAWALVIGIEQYRDLPSPTGARSDADRFARVLRETFGVPDGQLITASDAHATRSDLEKKLGLLVGRVNAGDRIYFFFSGHGSPDPSSGTPYLVPYDGDPAAPADTSLPLSDVLKRLSQSKAKEVLAFVDTCFSGSGGRSVLPAGTRPLVNVKAAEPVGSVVLFSAASGKEISGTSASGKSGLFSDYLVEALGQGKADLDGDGQITLKELEEWVRPRVQRDAKQAGRDQTPYVASPAGVSPDKTIVGWGYRRPK